MGVYIKDMEMPTSCEDCPLGDSLHCQVLPSVPALWAEYTNAIREKRLHNACPLVPVSPHGRLIDADAYEELIRGLGNREYRRENGTICDAIKFLHPHYTPTIIPAEEE